MNNPSKEPTKTEQAEQMARDGYGWEDLAWKLKIPKMAARYFVFGQAKKAGAA